MKMLHHEGLADRPARTRVEPLSPQAAMAVPAGSEVMRLPVGRPVGPILNSRRRNLNPGAFGNWLWPIDGRDRDITAIRLRPNRETDPTIVGREPAVQHGVFGMLQQWRLPMQREIEQIDLVRIAAKHQHGLLVARPVGSTQASFTQLLRCPAGSGRIYDPLLFFEHGIGDSAAGW